MPDDSSESFAERGGWIVVTQSVLMTAVVAAGPAVGSLEGPFWQRLVALTLILVGALFGIGGVGTLGRNRTIFPKPPRGARLVRHGVYRLVRHPLYASLMFLAAGWAVLWHSWLTAFLALLLTAQLFHKALREEAWLRERFVDYNEYADRVRRFIPWIW